MELIIKYLYILKTMDAATLKLFTDPQKDIAAGSVRMPGGGLPPPDPADQANMKVIAGQIKALQAFDATRSKVPKPVPVGPGF
jgi:hypothetical protein